MLIHSKPDGQCAIARACLVLRRFQPSIRLYCAKGSSLTPPLLLKERLQGLDLGIGFMRSGNADQADLARTFVAHWNLEAVQELPLKGE